MTTMTRKSLTWIHDDTEFYPHQIEGIRDLARRGSFILGDDMGLGKSLQALTVHAVDVERGMPNRVIVVATATLKSNWVEEIEKHSSFQAVVLAGTPAKRTKLLQDLATRDDWHVLIVNYEQVVPHLKELNALGFHSAIYDEAHTIKNPKAKRTQAAHGLHATRHMVLTGSPMMNTVNELWSLLHRVAPVEFPHYWAFVHRYCVFGGYKDKQIVGVQNEKELSARLQVHMLRRLKKDVLDLPEKQHIDVHVDLTPKQRKLYDEIKEEMKFTLPLATDETNVENGLTKFLRLKQVCGTMAAITGFEDESAKLDRAEEMIEELVAGGHKVVVWTQFRAVLECMSDRLDTMGIVNYELHGDVKHADRAPMVARWSKDGKPSVMVAMLQVAGVGLNMTCSRHAVFLDKLWVPKLNEQAEDRQHRIGADKSQPIQIFHLVARNTIESRIEAILRRKDRLFTTVVEQSDFKKKLYAALMEEDE